MSPKAVFESINKNAPEVSKDEIAAALIFNFSSSIFEGINNSLSFDFVGSPSKEMPTTIGNYIEWEFPISQYFQDERYIVSMENIRFSSSGSSGWSGNNVEASIVINGTKYVIGTGTDPASSTFPKFYSCKENQSVIKLNKSENTIFLRLTLLRRGSGSASYSPSATVSIKTAYINTILSS